MEEGVSQEENSRKGQVLEGLPVAAKPPMGGLCVEGIESAFGLGGQDLRSYSPLTLAYLGDAVYELVVRTVLVRGGNCPVNELHHRATLYVNVQAQRTVAAAIGDLLTEEEATAFRRGRNAHSPTMAKHASMSDYRHATGLEALVGYLYLKGDLERLLVLLEKGMSAIS